MILTVGTRGSKLALAQTNRTLQQIKELGVRPGVTLNPATPLSSLEEILSDVDMILIMSVNPGFGGQKFIPASLERIARLRQMLVTRGLHQVDIEVDGGVYAENAAQVVGAGATVLVIGSAIFNAKASVATNLAELRRAIENYDLDATNATPTSPAPV